MRGLAILLVFSLLTALTADLKHHAAHAGTSHDMSIGIVAGLETPAVDASYDIDIADIHPDAKLDHHTGAGSAGCHCCAVSCVALMMPEPNALDVAKRTSTILRRETQALLGRSAHSLYRPPIVLL